MRPWRRLTLARTSAAELLGTNETKKTSEPPGRKRHRKRAIRIVTVTL